jgi:hypothetical protein
VLELPDGLVVEAAPGAVEATPAPDKNCTRRNLLVGAAFAKIGLVIVEAARESTYLIRVPPDAIFP